MIGSKLKSSYRKWISGLIVMMGNHIIPIAFLLLFFHGSYHQKIFGYIFQVREIKVWAGWFKLWTLIVASLAPASTNSQVHHFSANCCIIALILQPARLHYHFKGRKGGGKIIRGGMGENLPPVSSNFSPNQSLARLPSWQAWQFIKPS